MTMNSSSSKTFLLPTGGLSRLRCSSIHRWKFSAFDSISTLAGSICAVNSVDSSGAPRPLGPYPHARRLGNLLFLSGIGPRHPKTEQIPDGIEAQTRACIENVKVILEDAGSSLEKVVDVTVFLTNLERDFAAYNRVYGEYFETIGRTGTTVGVVTVPSPISIELKVIAEG